MIKTDQDQVLLWIREHIKNTELTEIHNENKSPNDNTGADLILKDQGEALYFIEAIAFSVKKHNGKYRGTGKNQSDFWKAFSQACSRIKRNGKKEYAIIALPMDFLNGWKQRTQQFVQTVWDDMAPKEIHIWFVSKQEIIKLQWNKSYLFNPAN